VGHHEGSSTVHEGQSQQLQSRSRLRNKGANSILSSPCMSSCSHALFCTYGIRDSVAVDPSEISEAVCICRRLPPATWPGRLRHKSLRPCLWRLAVAVKSQCRTEELALHETVLIPFVTETAALQILACRSSHSAWLRGASNPVRTIADGGNCRRGNPYWLQSAEHPHIFHDR